MSLNIPLTRPLVGALTRMLTQAGAGGAAVYPLDEVGGTAPEAAYSTLKLRSAYAGSAVRLRRNSDNVEQDIGFVGNQIDRAAVTTFLSGTTGQVKTWYDQSGNARDATNATAASQPIFNNRLMSPSGVGVSFQLPHTLTIPAGVSVSRRACTTAQVVRLFGRIFNSTPMQLGSDTTNQRNLSGNNTGPELVGNPTPFTGIKPVFTPAIIIDLMSASNNVIHHNENTHTAAAMSLVTMVGGTIGNTNLTASYHMRGDSACHIVWGRVLDATEQTNLKDSLQAAFGIPASTSKQVVWDGDSIAVGSSNTPYDSYSNQAIPLISNTARHYNLGVGGNQISNSITQYAAVTSSIVAAVSGTVVVMNAGTNDIFTGGKSAATIYADIQTYCAAVRANSGKVIVCSILPRTGLSGAQETVRTDYNALVRAGWASFSDGFVDFAQDPVMGAAGAENNTALYPDGLHPSALGNSYLAPDVAAAVAALL